MVEDIRKYRLVDVGKSVLETCCLWIWKIELRKLDFLFASFVTFCWQKTTRNVRNKDRFFFFLLPPECSIQYGKITAKNKKKNQKEDENVWAKGKQSTLPFCIFYLSFRTKIHTLIIQCCVVSTV